MRLSDEFLSELRYRNNIESVVSAYVNLKRTGSTMKGLCPFHNEKTPSFTVYPENGSYYCFGCQNGGDVITFVRNIENLDYMEAVKLLCERSGMNMPETGYDDSAEKLRRKVLEINRETARFFHRCLMDEKIGVRARQYCNERRLSQNTVRHFGLGYAPDDWSMLVNHLKKLGYREEDMVLANVASRGRNGGVYDRFRHRFMFPIIDLRGNVIAFGGRKFPEDTASQGKYLNTNDTPVYKKSRTLYAMNFAKDSKDKRIILVEGYMDVISLHQAGFTNAVACCGTAFTPDQAQMIARYTDEVIVSLDSDGAGQKAARAAIEQLNKAGIKLRVLQIEGGKDPDEYIKTYGAERFKMLLDGAKNEIEFQLSGAKAKYDTTLDADKVSYLNDAIKILAAVSSQIAVDVYAGKLSEELKVDKQVILTQVSKNRKQLLSRKQKETMQAFTSPKVTRDEINPEATMHKRAAIAEEMIISILMRNPELADKTFSELSSDDFLTSFHRSVYTALKEIMSGTKSFDITKMSQEFSPQEMGRIVMIQNKSATVSDANGTLYDCMAVLREEHQKANSNKPADMSTDDWAQALHNLRDNKK